MNIRWLPCLVLLACVDPQEVETLKQNQVRILRSIDRIEQHLDAHPKQAPTKPIKKKHPGRPDPDKTYSVPIDGSRIFGAKDAWVTIAVFSDLECPFCARLHPTLTRLQEAYGDDLRIVFKHKALPFHKNADEAANAAECAAEQQDFWGALSAIFENNKLLRRSETQQNLEAILKPSDLSSWRRCYKERRYAGRIEKDEKLSVKIGVRGTPSSFVNGRFLAGAHSYEKFEKLVKEELQKAKNSGIPQAAYYKLAIEERGEKKL